MSGGSYVNAMDRPVRSASGRSRVNGRIVLVLATLLYAIAFHITYRDFVYPQQENWGAGYRVLPWSLLSCIYGVCVLPALWMPVEFKRPSQFLFYVQYYLVFIPSAFVVFYVSRPQLEISQAIELVLLMICGLTILQATYLFPLARFRTIRVAPGSFWPFLGALGVGLLAYTVAVLRSNFQLIGLAHIYEVRTAMADMLDASGNQFVAYAIVWMGNLVLPLAFAVGVFSRRWWLIAVVFLGYLFVFGVSGQKIALLATVYLPGFAWVLHPRHKNTGAVLASTFAAVLLSGYAIDAWLPPAVSFWYIAVIHFRTFSIQAINFVQYYVFFQTHPLTYFSHLAGFRWFIPYPYEIDVPRTLGYYYYNNPVGSNSGMWASDGIAAVGLVGVPIISMVAAVLFWLFDSCARSLNPRFVGLSVAYISATFANVSLGTTFISGGLSLLCLVLLALPRSGRFSRYYTHSRDGKHQVPIPAI